MFLFLFLLGQQQRQIEFSSGGKPECADGCAKATEDDDDDERQVLRGERL
jgi:hypothetical protein